MKYNFKRLLFPIFFFLVGAASLWCQDVRFPKPVGFVNDFTRIISYRYENEMTLIAEELQRKTGFELVVVTVPDMQGLVVEDYASRLYETWGIGKKENDYGALLLLALQERKMRIETGYGVEGILPDGLCGEIRDRYMLPDFRDGNYGQGFYKGMLAVTDIVAKDAGVQITGAKKMPAGERTKSSRGGGIFSFIVIVFLIIVTRGRILPWLLLGSMMGGGGRRGGGFSSGGGFGGGFGGFGGGMSGGGGASGSF